MNKSLIGCTISAKLGPEYGGPHQLDTDLIILGTCQMPAVMQSGNALQGKTQTIIMREFFVCHLRKSNPEVWDEAESNKYGPTIKTIASPFYILPEQITAIIL